MSKSIFVLLSHILMVFGGLLSEKYKTVGLIIAGIGMALNWLCYGNVDE